MSTAKPKIAIVDDDILNLDLLCCELSDQYDLYPISEGISSLGTFEEIMPDLIILDLMASGVDGVSLYTAQQQNRMLHHIPVIFVTAGDDAAGKIQPPESSEADCFTKPYNMEEIRTRIDERLKQAAAEKGFEASIPACAPKPAPETLLQSIKNRLHFRM